jgi:hypothetical protein
MASQTKRVPEATKPAYVAWRGELIAKFALVRAGLSLQPAPKEPFDLLASTPDGFLFFVVVKSYSSMHGRRGPTFGPSRHEYRWPVDVSILQAAGTVNVPVVLFVIDSDSEAGHHARLDHPPTRTSGQQKTFVSLTADRNLSAGSINKLVSELRRDSSVSRRPA